MLDIGLQSDMEWQARSSRAPQVAVVLPAYNEAETIAATIKDFHKALPEAAIWVVDNRCSDNTRAIAESTFQTLRCKGGVLQEKRPGKGNAVRRAFLEVEADIYVLSDADCTYPAEQVHQLIDPVRRGEADMVVGDRHTDGQYAAENKRPLHGFGNRLVRNLVNTMFRADLSDVMSGYRAFSRQFVKHYPILVEGFEIETDMTLHALDKRFRVLEVPVRYRDRPAGSVSKLNTFRDGARVLATIWNIMRHYRPLLFFGTAASLCALLGLAAGWVVIAEFIAQRYIEKVPLAILATGLQIEAGLLLSVGLILDSMAHQSKLQYERDLLNDRP
ncbi:glycosyltransferase [Hydrogenophaga sp.]|uniref:glycosyltransferase n=1 Tax=Hydrogenophaga sp. TaxID=1904254 RepID=UPI0027250A40|nr:glycosyltransferase [Hydrogenophaga sp.]MDO8903938.1 glycosyltransferase [Hydrogenophaga sp.]